MNKRWIVSWGLDSGKIAYYFTDRELYEAEAELTDLGGTANVSERFYGWVVAEVECGERPFLVLAPGEQGYDAVAAAITAHGGEV
jgi:hypothetical protein